MQLARGLVMFGEERSVSAFPFLHDVCEAEVRMPVDPNIASVLCPVEFAEAFIKLGEHVVERLARGGNARFSVNRRGHENRIPEPTKVGRHQSMTTSGGTPAVSQ